MGQKHSQEGGKSPAPPQGPVEFTKTESQKITQHSSEPDPLRHAIKPRDLIDRDPTTAVRRILPMVHQKICQLPVRINGACVMLDIYSHEHGPEAGLASSIRDLCETMKKTYRYLCSPKRAPETELPFSGPDLAEAIGLLGLKLERWVRNFERLDPRQQSRVEQASDDGSDLVAKCEQTTAVLQSIKNDRCLEIKSKRSTDRIFRSRGGHWSTSSSQPGMGRSIFGV